MFHYCKTEKTFLKLSKILKFRKSHKNGMKLDYNPVPIIMKGTTPGFPRCYFA